MPPAPLCLLAACALGAALAAPRPAYEEYEVPEKRAALVLDRLLVALDRALHDAPPRPAAGPRAAPLRLPPLYTSDMSSLQRRGQAGAGRGRTMRCYFNAVTCF